MTTDSHTGILQQVQRRRAILMGVLVLQTFCVLFLITEATMDIFGMELEDMLGTEDVMEFVVVVALLMGAGYLMLEFRRVIARQKVLEDQVKIASGAFFELLDQHFTEWVLTPSERDIAMFIIKGMSISEIAGLRNSAEGTIKAHSSRIYAKAGVTGRHQLISLFIEELLADGLTGASDGNPLTVK